MAAKFYTDAERKTARNKVLENNEIRHILAS